MIANLDLDNIVTVVADSLERSFKMISSIVRSGNDFETSLISDDALNAINNPEDKRKLDEAVDYLQRNTTEKSKDVVLSNNKRVTISIGN